MPNDGQGVGVVGRAAGRPTADSGIVPVPVLPQGLRELCLGYRMPRADGP